MKIVNNENSIITSIKKIPKNELMLLICAMSIFLPFILTCVVLFLFLIYLFLNREVMKKIMLTKRNYILFAFMILILVVPACYKRWVSVFAGLLIILILFFLLYAQQIMTEKLFREICDVSCVMSIVCLIYAVFEKIVYSWDFRSTGGLLNANYYGTIIEFVILICVYRIITNPQKKIFYFSIIALNIVGVFFCDCQSTWFAMLAGILSILILNGNKKVVIAFVIASLLIATALIFIPNLLPRLSILPSTYNRRCEIWNIAINSIPDAPVFGRGAMAFWFNNKIYGGYQTYHAHSIYLDPLISFGIVGTAAALSYMLLLVKDTFKNKLGVNSKATKSLLAGLAAAVLVHGITDYSLMWVQTGMLFCLILSASSIKRQQ